MCINEQRNCYHCFGCNEHGDIFAFVMKFLHVDFLEAAKILAEMASVEVPKKRSIQSKEKQERYAEYIDVYTRATTEYANKLYEPVGKKALEYLYQRGFTDEIIKKYNIGYAPDACILCKTLGKARIPSAIRAGLVRDNGNGCYDFFKNRIMFPITNESGDIVAFSGRSFDGTMPKYMNTVDTEFFHKKQTLFGLSMAKNDIYKRNRTIVVEGQIDCIKMQCSGYAETVAPLGSALTKEHVATICKMNRNIMFLFDGDDAGKKAAYKAGKETAPFIRFDSDVRVALLPLGEDPDSLLQQKGKKSIDEVLKSSIPLFEYIWSYMLGLWNTREILGRANFLHGLSEFVSLLEDTELRGIIRTEFVAKTLKRFYSKTDRIALTKRLENG